MDHASNDDARVRSESSNGGENIWNSDDSSVFMDHLVLMVHGILGSTTDWSFAARQFVTHFPDKVFVHCSERNTLNRTLDGIDVMGERLAEEVVEIVQAKPWLRKISFVAHSVGGLVARYAIGRLYKPPEENAENSSAGEYGGDSSGTICGLLPMNFITVATPHLGSRGNKQVPFLFGVPAFERAASCLIHWIFKRTGRHLFLTDSDSGKQPLLRLMVNDCGNLQFMSALRAFKHRVLYSNVGYDNIVGWRTSSIRRDCELPKWDGPVDKLYPHVVYEERTKGEFRKEQELPSELTSGFDMIEEELLVGLSQLSWEKVDVSFHSSKQRFAAHSIIQVKDAFVHLDGADIIRHMVNHFIA